MENLARKDLEQIEDHGLTQESVLQNLKTFSEGIPAVSLFAPATLGNGICTLSDAEQVFYAEKYDNAQLDVVKFVPASGAATRMFKDLQSFLKDLQTRDQIFAESHFVGLKNLLNAPKYAEVYQFFEHLSKFAFHTDLLSATKKQHPNFDRFSEDEKKYHLLKTLLDENQLNFPGLPKGLVPFHTYPNEIRTAFEEHFAESKMYATKKGVGKMHFTVAEKHLGKFEKEAVRIQEKLRKEHPNMQFEVDFSFQNQSTDTIAVDTENQPFRTEGNALVFRPAGHGALLNNLDQIDADLIFIKNIDNVSTENNLPTLAIYKKALAGILLELQQEAFGLLRMLQGFQNLVGLNKLNRIIPTSLPAGQAGSKRDLEGGSKGELARKERSEMNVADMKNETVQRARTFLKEKLNVRQEPKTLSELKTLLDRPIRVCGMVKNTGAPGGGPFWVKNEDGTISLQIVETAQIDQHDSEQCDILDRATHFNPVDLVCGVKDFKGGKFDLTRFSNPKKGFITYKSLNGRDLKALELPGLWNGAMDNWNSIFVEVPLETFSPVKTVVDLLKPAHQ